MICYAICASFHRPFISRPVESRLCLFQVSPWTKLDNIQNVIWKWTHPSNNVVDLSQHHAQSHPRLLSTITSAIFNGRIHLLCPRYPPSHTMLQGVVQRFRSFDHQHDQLPTLHQKSLPPPTPPMLSEFCRPSTSHPLPTSVSASLTSSLRGRWVICQSCKEWS